MQFNKLKAASENIEGGVRIRVLHGSGAMNTLTLLELLAADAEFAECYNALLADSLYAAFFWELPPLTRDTATDQAEFVLLDAPLLAARQADPEAFKEYFATANNDAVVFPSLGGDATLIVPCQISTPGSYTHLANFVREAPAQQTVDFWRLVATTVLSHIGDIPLWVSTSGLGVNWLHVRLDTQPKYYQHRPYKLLAQKP
jgi:hypothetical protein